MNARNPWILLLGALGLFAPACGDNVRPAIVPDAAIEPDAEVYQVCGDGLITGNEQCDDGNDSNDDACLSTCVLACGDGVVNAAELCDTGIVTGQGACPTACSDGDSCTTDVLAGDGCQAQCIFTNITEFMSGDGCCPPGGNSSIDGDCPVVCGNSVVEAGESCDTGIEPGLGGACPDTADCIDNVACTSDVLDNPGTCTAACRNDPITTPANDDGCCPEGGTVGNDNDCSGSCGDGIFSPSEGETCDIAIGAGSAGACPTAADCVDSNACTEDVLLSGGTCSAVCDNQPITVIGQSDGCCPPGGNANNDVDCPPVCGNGVLESGEQCDDGNTTGGDGCDGTCRTEITATAYRIRTLELRDPHAYARLFVIDCTDITGNLNTELGNAITMDGDGDGLLDLSAISLFRPLDQAATTTPLEIVFADCTAPLTGTRCSPPASMPAIPSTAHNQSTGTCLTPTTGTVRPYSPAVTNTTAPCYASDPETLVLDLGGIRLPLSNAQVAATYVGNPATSMTNGLLKGFISEADANATVLPASLPIVGGQTLSSLLPGGTGNCSTRDDRDMLGTVRGWWVYFNFTAEPVLWSEP